MVAFLDSWVAGRRWPVDMAGFAVNLAYMSQYPRVNMPFKPGYEEDLFLRSIDLHIDQIEPKGANCTEVLVWHTQTKNKKSAVVRLENSYLDDRSNLGALFRSLRAMGVARASETEGEYWDQSYMVYHSKQDVSLPQAPLHRSAETARRSKLFSELSLRP